MFTKPKPTLPPSDFDSGLTQFITWLRQYHLSAKTVKNYASDVRRFFLWHSEKIGNITLENLTPAAFAAYLRYLEDNGFPDSTQARKLASLRKFEQFWQSVSLGSLSWQLPANPGTSTKDELAWGKILQRFVLALTKSGCKETTVQNYVQDVRLFLNFWPAAPLVEICTKPKIATYLEKERQNGRSAWTLRQRLQSLHRFTAWAHREEYLPSDPLASQLAQTLQTTAERFVPLAWFKPRVKPGPVESLFADPEPAPQLGGWRGLYAWYSRLALASYLHLAILLVFCVMVGVFGYQQFFSEVAPRYAYPSEAVRPNRVLSFQGRLTDSGATPITTPINFVFRLYDAKTGGNELWDSSDSGVCSLDPDQDGVFSVLLGDNVEGCGNEITDGVFSQRSEVWLEVQVSTETLTPRQPIVTVPYALNSETVQGFPVSLAGGINTIPVINALGEVIIGASNPKLIASSGAFLIQGETLTLQTEPGSGGSINLAPDAGGSVNVLSATTTQNSLYLSNASLTTGSLIRGEVGNNNLTNLISLAAGSVLDNKFVVDTLGNTTLDGYLQAPGATLSATYAGATPLIVNGTGGQILALNNAGQLSLATQGSSGGLVLGGDTNLYRSGANELTTSDSLVIGANLTASSLGTAGGVIYAQNASGLLGVTAVGSTGECLISDGVNAPYWGSCGTGGGGGGDGYWTANGPVLHPINTSLDLGIGGTSSASAKFQVFADSGTATSQGQLTFRGALDPKINVLNGENFGLLTSVGGDTGLVERLTLLNSGNVGIGDTTPAALLTVGTGDLFQVNASGNIAQIGGVAHNLANSSGNLVLTSNGELYLNDSRTGDIALSVTDTALNAGLPQGLIDAINTLYNGGQASDVFWTQASGILRTVNNTVDVLFGGTSTASAKFAFINVANGIPTASISAGAAGSSYLTAAGNLATTAMQNLILGSATTGDITLQPRGGTGGLVTISAPTLRFDQAGSITTTTGTLTLAPSSNLQFFNANNTITSGGNLTIAGDLTVNGGTISRTGNLSITTGGTGNLTLNSAGELYLSDSRTGNIPLSITDTNLNSFASGDRAIIDALNFLFGKAVPGAAGTQAGFWSRLAGLLYPTDTWESLALGGSATATAKIHLNASNGTASIAGALAFTGLGLNPKIDVLNGENFGLLTSVGGDEGLAERFTILNAGNVGIGDTTPAALLTVGNGDLFQINTSGNIVQVGGVAHSLADSSGNLVLTSNGELYLNDSRTGNIALSVADTALNANLTQGIVDAINDNYDYATLYDAFWVQNNANGTLRTTNSSVDVLFGGISTASAKFQIFANNGTATSQGQLTFRGTLDPKINILNGENFGIRSSVGGDNGLTERFTVLNDGKVGIGTTNPGTKLEINNNAAGSLLVNRPAGAISSMEFRNTAGSMYAGIDNDADFAIKNAADINTANWFLVQNSTGNVGIRDTTPLSLFTVGTGDLFQINTSGNIVAIGGVAHSLANSSGNLVITSNGELSFNDVRTGDIRLSVADTALNVGLTQGLVDAINDLYDAQQSGGSSLWAQLLGAIFPVNPSYDVLIGGTSTASAKFAFINVDANNPNVPTASISSKVAGLATYLTGDGTLATTNLANLTLGSATTGDIIFNPYGNNAGRVGIHTTNPLAVFHTTGAYSDHALAIFDQLFSGDILTASVGGVTKLRITNAGDIAFNQASSITTSTGTLTLNPAGNLQFFSGSNFITSAGNLTVAGNITLGGGHTLTNTSSNLTLTSTSPIVTINDNLYIAGQNIVDSSNNAYISLLPENLFDVFPTKKIIVSGLLDVTGYVNGQRGATFSAFVPSDKLLVLNGDDHGQTADYINVNTRGMTGGNIFKVTANGLTGINVTGSPSAQLQVQTNTSATRGLIVQGSTGQSANLTEWRNSSGTVLAHVDESGNFRIGNTAPDRGLLAVSGGNGNALATLNQTSLDQNILVASASGVTRASIDRFGDYTMYGPKKQATTASITDVFVYDTSADLDGGRWTDSAEAKATSWYNETIDATGETCVPASNDRCGTAVFPKKAVIQADASGLQIYDADTQTMWMRFAQGTTALGADANNNPSVVRALNGRVYVGTNGSAATGLYIFDFAADTVTRYDTSGRWLSQQRIASRNSANTFNQVSAITKIPSNIVNDLSASTILGDGKQLPMDNTTYVSGRYTTVLPAVLAEATEHQSDYSRDYVAVGTDGGVNGSVSLIQPDLGNMANIGIVKAPIASKNVFLLNDGTLYYTYRDQNNNANDKLKVLHNSHTMLSTDPMVGIVNTASRSADIIYANKSSNTSLGRYGVAYADAYDNALGLNNGPTFPRLGVITADTPVVNDLWVTKGTSSVDGRGNTIYLADDTYGVTVINEKVGDEQNGSAKRYTKDYITPEMPGDIRGAWSFEGYPNSLVDADLGNGDNSVGTGEGEIGFTQAGVRGSAASFDADTGYLWGLAATNTTYLANLNTQGALTVGAWINPTDLTGRRVVLAKNGDTTMRGYRLSLENGAPLFQVSGNGFSMATASSSAALSTNSWYHLVGVMTPDKAVELYVNGELVARDLSAPAAMYQTPAYFRIGMDDQYPNNISLSRGATTTTMSGLTRLFQVGDYIHVRNVTANVNTTTVVTAISYPTITVLDALGGNQSDTLLVSKLNEGTPVKGVALDGTFKIITGPTGDSFSFGDLVSVYNASTGAKYLVGVQTTNTTTRTNITVSAAVGTATTDQTYVARVSRESYVPNLGVHDANRKIVNVDNGSNYFKVGDYVHVLDHVTAIVSTPTVVLSTTATSITVLDAIANATTDDVYITKINKYDPIAGTAASATQITGPNYSNFSAGDLVELTNTTDSEKVQSTVTAVNGTTITVSAGTASQTGAETIYVAKINNSRAGTERFDGLIDEVFVSGSTVTPEFVKHIFEAGWGALQYHTANRLTGLTGADTYQQFAGAGAAGATVTRTKAVFVDEQKKLLYVGNNDSTTNTGGVSVISLYSDSVVDYYDDTNNTTKKDDAGTQFDATDVVAISAAGNLPKYLAIAGTNDTTTKLWLEKGDASLNGHLNNNYNPHGTTLNQTNLRIEDTLYLGKVDGQQNYLETSGNLTKFYGNLQISGDTVLSGQLLANERKSVVKPLIAGSSDSDDGTYVQMEVGGDYLPRLVFYDATLNTLKYLRCISADCKNYYFRVLDDGGGQNNTVGTYIDTDLGPDNLLRITYYDTTATRLFFMRCLDDDCREVHKAVVSGKDSNGTYSSVAIRQDGTAVILTTNATTSDLELISCLNIDCTVQKTHILDDDIVTYNDIVLDANDLPRIAYLRASYYLGFIACEDRDCFNYTKQAPTGVTTYHGSYVDIELDSSSYPIIASYDANTTDILYVQCSATDCATSSNTNLDVSGSSVGSHLSMVLLSGDKPVMSYYDATNADLRVLACTSITCASTTITTIDSGGTVGTYTSIGINSKGYPIIAYYGTTLTEVKLANCTVATCASGSVVSSVYSYFNLYHIYYQQFVDHVVGLDNFSRIIFQDYTNLDLYYLRCLDADCDSFTTRFLDGTGIQVNSVAMTLGHDGFARIAYTEYAPGYAIKYIRCNDDDCTAPVITTVLDQYNSQAGASSTNMAYGGNIAIGRDGFARISADTASGVMFVRCLNADCTASNADYIASGASGVYAYSDLILDPNDYAAVVVTYPVDATYYMVYYHCTNLDCTSNDTPTGFANSGSTFVFPKITVNPFTGLPMISVAWGATYVLIYNCGGWEDCYPVDGAGYAAYGAAGNYGAQVDKNTGNILVGAAKADGLSLSTCTDYQCEGAQTTSDYKITRPILGTPYNGDMKLRYYGSRTEAVFALAMADGLYYVVVSGTNYNIGSTDRPFSNVFADKINARNTTINGLDLAEEYPVGENDIGAGDVVSFDPSQSERVLRSRVVSDPNVAGVVSSAPGVLLQDENATGRKVPLALSGRVPVKIDPDSPPIKVGDWLTSSGKPGLAKKATDPGYMVGRALKDWSCTAAEPSEEPAASESASPATKCPLSTIVFVQLGYYNPDIILAPDGEASSSAELATIEASISGSLANGDSEINYIVRDAAGRIVRQVGRFSQTWIGKIVAGMVQTKELVADQATINDELRVPAIRTDWIGSTASGSGDITIDLSRTLASDSAIPDYRDFGTLLVKGNASVSGTLFASDLSAYSARLVQLESQQADVLLLRANDASVSGTLRAGRLEGEVASSQISDLEDRVSGIISRQRATSVSASESGLLAGNYQIQHLIDLLNGSPLAASTDPWGNITSASSSGGLTLADLAQINQDVQINGLLAVNNLMVQDALTLGSTFFHQNELSWNPGEAFAIQPSGQGQVSFLASTLVISADGGVTINHNLAVTGSVRAGQGLFADSLQPNANQNIEVQLASAAQPDRLGELIIRGRDNQEIAAFSASGSARLRKLIIASENAAADGETATSVITNATAGTATLPVQTTSFVIRNSQVHDGSLLYITPTSSTQNHVLFVQSKTAENPDTPENEGQFVVAIDAPIDQTINFNWWIIN